MDQEFDKIVDQMEMAIVNTTAAREHVTDAERGIRCIKDSGRCTMAELRRIGIITLPKQVIIHIVYFVVFWLNAPPATNGISEVHSPREIVLGRSIDYNLHCRATFGQYVHAHIDPDITNDMKGRTFAGISRSHGKSARYSQSDGPQYWPHKKVKNFTEVPMPDSAIDLVNVWGKRYRKSSNNGMIMFLNRLKERFAWDNDEYEIPVEDLPHPDIPVEFPGVILDTEDDVEPLSALLDETAEEEVQRVSKTTGVPAHGAGTTGVQGADTGTTGNVDPATVVVLNTGYDDQGEDADPETIPMEDVEEDEDDFDDETTTPEFPPTLDVEDNLPGEQDEVQTQPINSQGGNAQGPAFSLDDQGRRRSNRERRAPTDYIPDGTNVRYTTVEGAAHANISDVPLRKFTEMDQLIHVPGIAMI